MMIAIPSMINGIKKFLSLRNEIVFRYQLSKRKNLDITAVEELSQDIPLEIFLSLKRNYFVSNHYYGNEDILKKYAKMPSSLNINLTIEHSIIVSNKIWDLEINYRNNSGIVTQSCYREEIIKHYTDLPIYNIGRFLLYADSYFSPEELIKQKKKFGKCLLYFPSHSTHLVCNSNTGNWDINLFGNLSKDFDTILVCIYWKDVLNGFMANQISPKVHYVSAGHMFDPLFYSRLRSIISLADLVVCDDISGSLANCVALEKPCFILNRTGNYITEDVNELLFLHAAEKTNFIVDLRKLFSDPDSVLSDRQKEAIDFYYGIKKKYSQEELQRIFMKHLRK